MTNPTRSQIFTAYNGAMALVRQGQLDAKSTRKALGIAQRKAPRPYISTATNCNCPDRSGIDASGRRFKLPATYACKHMIAAAIREVA
jgi:hypothetical protein